MWFITLVLVSVFLTILPVLSSPPTAAVRPYSNPKATVVNPSDRILKKALKEHLSEFTVRCSGTVTRILSDDTHDIAHQRFIIRLASGQTLLVVHNIDLAPRIASLKIRDSVMIKGEYIWNEKGGLMHLTHRDSDGTGFHGFIRHKGTTYQ